MSFFPAAVEAALAGANVRMTYLVKCDFATTPMYVWSGYGSLVSGGQTWQGVGELAGIEQLEQATDGTAPEAQFVLSGVDATIVATVRDDFTDECADQLITVYAQFFNDANNAPLTLYDDPYAIWSGRMRRALFSLSEDGTRAITVTAESLFALRSRPNFGMYTDRDQQQRYSGDRGFEYTPRMVLKSVTWPDF